MAGHNKWSKVKHIKAKEDAKKGKVFARYAREIMIATKNGGGDPDLNPRLRAAIDGAKAVSTPKENIERAIKKGLGELGGAEIQEMTYEGYGPAGTAFIVEVATDNINRSASELRTLFSKNGGSIGTQGSVAYQFDRKGEVRIMDASLDEDSAMDVALEVGADEVETGDSEEEWVFLSPPTELGSVAEALRGAGKTVTSMKLVSVAQNMTEVADLETAQAVMKLYEALDDYDDAVNVFSNFDISEEVLEQM